MGNNSRTHKSVKSIVLEVCIKAILLYRSISIWEKGDFQNANKRALIQAARSFSFGKTNAISNGKIIIPTISDSLPVSQLENLYFR